jgi:hypothetical protein
MRHGPPNMGHHNATTQIKIIPFSFIMKHNSGETGADQKI